MLVHSFLLHNISHVQYSKCVLYVHAYRFFTFLCMHTKHTTHMHTKCTTHTHTRMLHAHIHVRSFRMLEADVGRTPYPDYDIIVTKPLFSSAEEFTRYVCPAASQCLSSYWYYVHVRCLCILVCTHAWW